MSECAKEDRQKNEISMLERYALRWAVLAAWSSELRERQVAVAREVDQKLEMSRVKLASGCFSSCEVGSDLGYIEGMLMPADASSPKNKCDFWLELLGHAMEDVEAVRKLLSVPAIKFQMSSCGVKCSCGM